MNEFENNTISYTFFVILFLLTVKSSRDSNNVIDVQTLFIRLISLLTKFKNLENFTRPNLLTYADVKFLTNFYLEKIIETYGSIEIINQLNQNRTSIRQDGYRFFRNKCQIYNR